VTAHADTEVVAGSLQIDLKREVMAWLHTHQAELIEEWKSWQR